MQFQKRFHLYILYYRVLLALAKQVHPLYRVLEKAPAFLMQGKCLAKIACPFANRWCIFSIYSQTW